MHPTETSLRGAREARGALAKEGAPAHLNAVQLEGLRDGQLPRVDLLQLQLLLRSGSVRTSVSAKGENGPPCLVSLRQIELRSDVLRAGRNSTPIPTNHESQPRNLLALVFSDQRDSKPSPV